MLNDIYKAIKTQLNTISLSEDTQWFNMQYENSGWLYPNGFFVEFPDPLKFESISKDARRTNVKIRIHVYSKDIQTSEGIPDETVDAHETLALAVKTALSGFVPQKTGEDLTRKMIFTGWQHFHRFKDWMVTFVEFDTKMMLT